MRHSLLDLFRALAIILVIIYHIGLEINSASSAPIFILGQIYPVNLGNLGVIIFIILSGLVLELKYGKQKINYFEFIVKRFLRIYSTLFFCLIVGALIYYLVPKDILSLDPYYVPMVGLSDLVCSLTGFCNFLLRVGGPFLPTSWFIGIIVPLYLLFPLLSKKFKNKPLAALFVSFLITLFFRFIMAADPLTFFRLFGFAPLLFIFEFGLGIYLARMVNPKLWLSLNKYIKTSAVLSYLGVLSFPLFLLHYPFLFIINYFSERGISYLISIPLYLFAALISSFLILKLANRISVNNKATQP